MPLSERQNRPPRGPVQNMPLRQSQVVVLVAGADRDDVPEEPERLMGCRAGFLAGADRAVAADEALSLTVIDAAFPATARRVSGRECVARDEAEKHEGRGKGRKHGPKRGWQVRG